MEYTELAPASKNNKTCCHCLAQTGKVFQGGRLSRGVGINKKGSRKFEIF